MPINDPRDIPGLLVWLSSEGSPLGLMTTWKDLSGNGNHAAAISGGDMFNTETGVAMTNGPGFALPTTLFNGVAAGEIFVSTKHTDYGGLLFMGGGGGNYSHHPYFDGNYYEHFGSSERPGFAGAAMGVRHRFHVLSAPGKWMARINENVAYNRDSNTVTWLTGANSAPQFGHGGGPGATYQYDGEISCVLIYGRRLTDDERTQVDVWLAAHMFGGVVAAAPAPVVIPPVPVAEPVSAPSGPRLTWDERSYEGGVDRGVLYLPTGGAVPWNGLKAITPENDGEGSEALYFDGIKFMDVPVFGDLKANLTASVYPEEFLQIEGWTEVVDGMVAGDQQPLEFNMSFRSLIGNEVEGYDYGYRIHLLYNLKATFAPRKYSSLGSDLSLTEFTWDIYGSPERITGFRPTAHAFIDTRFVKSAARLLELEKILYGTPTAVPRLPSLQEMVALAAA